MSTISRIETENTICEILKDTIELHEEVGGPIEDSLAFASELHGCSKKLTKNIQRTMHKLIMGMSLVNS